MDCAFLDSVVIIAAAITTYVCLPIEMETPLSTESSEKDDHNMTPETEFPRSSLPWSTRLVSRFTSDIDTKWGDVILLGCFLLTGMVDSVAFNTYSCFVGMQTGEFSDSSL